MRARFEVPAALVYITEPRRLLFLFVAVLLLVYVIVPFWLGLSYGAPYMSSLAGVAGVGAFFVLVGFYLPITDLQFGPRRWAIAINARVFHIVVWSAFAVYCVVVFSTAKNIPILTALHGHATEVTLDQERAEFLKMRQGWEVSLAYIGGIFAGAVLPYSIASLLRHHARGRYGALAAYMLYAESFLQKALFLQVLLPVYYLVAQRKLWNFLGLIGLLLLTALLLFGNARLVQRSTLPALPQISLGPSKSQQATEGGGGGSVAKKRAQDRSTAGGEAAFSFSDWFDAAYIPQSSLEKLVWRAVAVPVFTARDALAVFHNVFKGKLLWGSTSSFVAKVLSLNRVNYDAAIYKYEWGGRGYGRSNTAYFLEGFVNFGWFGVILFSLIVGQCFRIFQNTADDALRAMSPLFAYYVIQASLVGTMLSAGFVLVFLLALFVDVRWVENPGRQSLSPMPGE